MGVPIPVHQLRVRGGTDLCETRVGGAVGVPPHTRKSCQLRPLVSLVLLGELGRVGNSFDVVVVRRSWPS
jgi:hypothetical protein